MIGENFLNKLNLQKLSFKLHKKIATTIFGNLKENLTQFLLPISLKYLIKRKVFNHNSCYVTEGKVVLAGTCSALGKNGKRQVLREEMERGKSKNQMEQACIAPSDVQNPTDVSENKKYLREEFLFKDLIKPIDNPEYHRKLRYLIEKGVNEPYA